MQAVVVSPLIPRGTVDHTVYHHSSIPATLERLLHLNPLTNRDEGAHDVLHLLTQSAPREDCPLTLSSPARAGGDCSRQALTAEGGALSHAFGEIASDVEALLVERVGERFEAMIDAPLTDSGNVIGALHILLKTELECGRLDGNDDEAQARIRENYQRVKTIGDARAYVKAVSDRLETRPRP